MSEQRLAALGVAFGLVGLGLLFFPRFMMHLRGRWSLGVARWLIETFPEKTQTIVGRLFGLSFIILGAWILSNHGAVGFGLKKEPETLSEWKQDVYDDKDYHEQAVVEGPAYTQAVIDQVRVTHHDPNRRRTVIAARRLCRESLCLKGASSSVTYCAGTPSSARFIEPTPVALPSH